MGGGWTTRKRAPQDALPARVLLELRLGQALGGRCVQPLKADCLALLSVLRAMSILPLKHTLFGSGELLPWQDVYPAA